MKTTNRVGKQGGFFTVGLGLALFAIFGAMGTGVTVVSESGEHHNERVSLQTESESASLAENKLYP